MSKVEQWIACDLRYVAETKLGRLTDDELAKLYFGIGKKHGLSITSVSADRDVMIGKLMQMKREIQVAYSAAAAVEKAQTSAEATKAVEAIFEAESNEEAGSNEEGEEAEAPIELTDEELAAKRDREERASALIQLAAAIRADPEPALPPTAEEDPTGQSEDCEARPSSPVTVDTHHRLRICSFNACKMRLGSANKAYVEASECADKDEYEGTHKGAELAQKWLTLAARMADFDAILLQEVPGTEKVMNEKVETFAAMLDIATDDGQFWTAVSSEKSGKDGKVVGPGAEVHVCFIKSPLEFKGWNTLRKVGATELDYAPLQVQLHDPRFADPADQNFVVTSVHLPPSKRVEARDSQIAALLRNYSAPDTSEYRMQQPFKPNKESKVAPTHIIAGDFNTYPGNEQYNMLGSGFVSKIPKDAATTSGHQNYDNVLVDAHANDRLLVGGGILQLKNPHNAAKGEIGLSDHYPVFIEVCEVQKTGKQPTAAALLPVVESEFVANEGEEKAPPPLEPVPEEAAGEPQPPLAEAPAPAPARKDRNYDDAGSVGSGTSESEYLTDDGGPVGLPRLVDDEELVRKCHEEEQAVREVVGAAMEQVAQSVVAAAAAAATEPEPEPEPDAIPEPEPEPEPEPDAIPEPLPWIPEPEFEPAPAPAPAPAPELTPAEAPPAAAAPTEAPPPTHSPPPEPEHAAPPDPLQGAAEEEAEQAAESPPAETAPTEDPLALA
jgi:endonuclease/exonuclease/phosphatase family metal-dependent hydrolase